MNNIIIGNPVSTNNSIITTYGLERSLYKKPASKNALNIYKGTIITGVSMSILSVVAVIIGANVNDGWYNIPAPIIIAIIVTPIVSISILSVGIIGYAEEKYFLKKEALNNNNNYEDSLKKANVMIVSGILLNVTGIFLGLVMPLFVNKNNVFFMFFGGIVSTFIATPLFIYGLAERARAKEKIVETEVEVNESGVGLRLSW